MGEYAELRYAILRRTPELSLSRNVASVLLCLETFDDCKQLDSGSLEALRALGLCNGF